MPVLLKSAASGERRFTRCQREVLCGHLPEFEYAAAEEQMVAILRAAYRTA